jgi:hypothetical protein
VSTWLFKQWPVPLILATALILMLAVQRFGDDPQPHHAASASSRGIEQN